MRKLRLLLPFALLTLLLSFALAACGGGGESDEEKIVGMIETSATSTDPANCKETQTQQFMEQTSGGSGGEAVKECEKETQSGEDNPEAVNVSKVKVEGEKATADVEFEGGNFSGQTVEVALVEEEGDWKLNELTGFAKFDPTQLIGALAKKLEEEPEIEPETASCIVEGIEEMRNSELEALVIENNTEPIVEIAEGCE